MIGVLTLFVGELRQVGIPVSMVESIDAARAVEHVPLEDRQALRHSLAACLVKNSHHLDAFDAAFDAFFSVRVGDDSQADGKPVAGPQLPGSGGGEGEVDIAKLVDGLLGALAAAEWGSVRLIARQSVGLLAGMAPGRPVGGRYYRYRVLSRLGVEGFLDRLMEQHPEAAGLDRRLLEDEYRQRITRFEDAVRDEIQRRLVDDRGPEAVARTTRHKLLEDIDLAHAGRAEIDRMERVIQPLARKLASRLAQRRRHLRRGRLDVRSTVRRSLSTGGSFAEPRFRTPKISKPEIVLLCDISGSVAAFAHFTMQLTYAMSSQFSKVRAFAFIDGVDEVTELFAPGVDFHESIVRISREANVVHFDGHSDYGNVFERFWEQYSDSLTPRSNLIITGDARTNYRPAGVEVLDKMADRARATYWLNPEPTRFWNTGDSVMHEYLDLCDGVFEVRTLRQLEHFIEELSIASTVHSTRVKI